MPMQVDILAFEFGDLAYVIAMLIIAGASGLGNLFKGQKDEPEEKKTIIIPPPPTQGQAPPAAQRQPQRPVARGTPLGGAPTPPPIARQGPTQPRPPRPVSQAATPPQRPRPAPPRRVTPEEDSRQVAAQGREHTRGIRGLNDQRTTPVEHAELVAEHAEHVANKLREEQLIKKGKLKPGEHRHGPVIPAGTSSGRQVFQNLRPQTMKQAFLFSEIFRPPIALRGDDHLKQ